MSRVSRNPEFDHGGEKPRVSPALGADLRALIDPGELKVPPALTQRILSDARAHFARQRRSQRRSLRWMGVAASVAAAAIITFVVWINVMDDPASDMLHVTSVPADIDGNGRVDILDALVLARRVEASAPNLRDITGDGVVDSRDVDAVAMRAVSLVERGGLR